MLTDARAPRPENRRALPQWAILQRELLDELSAAALDFAERYCRADGTLIWRDEWPGMDGSDDPYEGFRNMPLLYALGGDDALLPRARQIWDGITWQWTQYGQIRDEFDRAYDWMHHGEAYLFSYFMGLADPESLKERQRAIRFADLYTRDDGPASNFDSQAGLMRAPVAGSDGPHFVHDAEDWSTHLAVLDHYLPPFEDLPGVAADATACPWSDPGTLDAILDRINTRQARGDVPLNLLASSMAVHALAFGGGSHYRDWLLRYLETWRALTDANGGITPDNVGISGVIGEHNDGKWWGGFYGWRWPHGAFSILEPLCAASLNAVLLTGDMTQLNLARSQIDMLWDLGRDEAGRRVSPTRHYDDGWRDYRPFDPGYGVHLWNVSMDEADAERAERAWSARYDRIDSSYGTYRLTNGGHAGFSGNTAQWFRYIRGKAPDYPEAILAANARVMREQVARYRSPEFDPRTMDDPDDPHAIHVWQQRTPLVIEGLAQLMTGGPMHLYHGGLQHARFRYFDADRRRPGLPKDVAAMVEAIAPDRADVTLVNLSTTAEARVVVQGGMFAEHALDDAQVLAAYGPLPGITCEEDRIELTLAPSSETTLRIGMRRFARQPSYQHPWQQEWPAMIRGRSKVTRV